MNLLQLKNLTAYWLDDLSFGYFTEAQVTVFLNNAQKRLQKRLISAGQNYYTKCVQTTLVVNQMKYALPADFKKEHRLEIVVSGTAPNEAIVPLSPITINQRDFVPQGSGTPQVYTIQKNYLYLRQPPNAALTLRMVYSYEIADLINDTDIPDVPESYHEGIALYAAEDGFIKDGRTNALHAKKLKEFNDEIDKDAQERNQDVPRSVVVTEAYAEGYDW